MRGVHEVVQLPEQDQAIGMPRQDDIIQHSAVVMLEPSDCLTQTQLAVHWGANITFVVNPGPVPYLRH